LASEEGIDGSFCPVNDSSLFYTPCVDERPLQDRKQHTQMDRVPQFNSNLLQIVTNVFVQIVILLYLIDNNENTSWMILFGSATGVLIEAWKVNLGLCIRF
jgi:hypothetical protein